MDWSLGNALFLSLDPADQQFLLESALTRLLLIDLATVPELAASPYVRYIFETYFINSSSSNGITEETCQVTEAVRFIEALALDRTQAAQLKMLVLLQSGKRVVIEKAGKSRNLSCSSSLLPSKLTSSCSVRALLSPATQSSRVAVQPSAGIALR